MTSICLDCRTAFTNGGRCDGEAHETINLSSARARLVETVWGSLHDQIDAVRRVHVARTRGLRSTASGIGVGALAGVLVGLGPAAVFATMVGGSVVTAVLSARRQRRNPPARPHGAAPLPDLTRFARGRIHTAEATRSPASGLECAAWALELRYDAVFGSRVMLRVGQTEGMEIILDNGERARIPAGSVRLAQELPQLADYDLGQLESWLRSVDPARSLGSELCPPFPFNVIGEVGLQVGDRVELFQGYEPAVIIGASAALYRDAPATILVPRSVATLRRVG